MQHGGEGQQIVSGSELLLNYFCAYVHMRVQHTDTREIRVVERDQAATFGGRTRRSLRRVGRSVRVGVCETRDVLETVSAAAKLSFHGLPAHLVVQAAALCHPGP